MAKKRILICDDEKDILEVIQMILQVDYEVAVAAGIEDPVALVKSVNPDLILMDIFIPNMGGEEAVRRLKNEEETKLIPVIFLSANNETKEIARHAGADGYISKPFEVRELKELIATKLES